MLGKYIHFRIYKVGGTDESKYKIKITKELINKLKKFNKSLGYDEETYDDLFYSNEDMEKFLEYELLIDDNLFIDYLYVE